MTDVLHPLLIQPGIQRDGTNLAKSTWIDGQWVRFQRGLPQKMGGYKQICGYTNSLITSVPRGLFIVANNENFNIYVGTASTIGYYTIDNNGNFLSYTDLTAQAMAANPFIPDPNNLWTFDTIVNRASTPPAPIIIMSVAPNLAGINQSTPGPVYYYNQKFNIMEPLGIGAVGVPLVVTDGGVVNLDPYLMIYGSNGSIRIQDPENPNQPLPPLIYPANIIYQGISKIVTATVTRGGNSSPAGLFWSLSSLIRCTFVPATATQPIPFVFDVISDQISILSSRCMIEYDGLFYWCATNRFLVYTGVVQEMGNDSSINYFFNNLNFDQANKVWATKVPHYGEIWWHWPMGTATECNKVLILNVHVNQWSIRDHNWYDTSFNTIDGVAQGRSCGFYNQIFESPIYADSYPNPAFGNNYALWQHEFGVDQNVDGQLTAIDSFVESNDISWVIPNAQIPLQPVDRWVYLYRIELDMIQDQAMTLFVNGQEYARSPVVSISYVFQPTDVKIDMREQRRLMTLRFESNAIGGYYEFGRNLLNIKIGDARQ